MEEKIVFVRVFVPYHNRYHLAYYAYDENEYGHHLPFGTCVYTSMKLGIIVEDDVPETLVPPKTIYDIDCLADEKETEIIRKEWWDVIMELHRILSKREDE